MYTIIIFIALFVIISAYNSIIIRRNRVKARWSVIDTQLQRRNDLIPNLVETVKGYAKHEKDLFENIAELRTSFQISTTVGDKARIEGQMQYQLQRLLAVSEDYPELKASKNFLMLQEELVSTENKVAYSRTGYNNSVLDYNNIIEVFPTVLFAKVFKFNAADFFEVENDQIRENVKINM